MSRHKDKTKAEAPSDFKPVLGVEGYKRRHERRYERAMREQSTLVEWCAVLEIKLGIHNQGHHWRMTRDGHSADWWPSTAKLVFDSKYAAGVHTHTIQQVMELVTKRWRLNK